MAVNPLELGQELFVKIGQELRDPRQFLDPERRRTLAMQCLGYLRALGANNEIRQLGLDDFEQYSLPDGTELFFGLPRVGVIFPSETKISYHPEDETIPPDESSLYGISAPTVSFGPVGSGHTKFPNQGYRDSKGTRFPFLDRKQEDKIQHGGLFVDNSRQGNGNILFLAHETLVQFTKATLKSGQFVIEGNWYMNSATQVEVCERRNMKQPRPYNCIGMFHGGNAEGRLFTINTAYSSLESLAGIVGRHVDIRFVHRPVVLYEMAAVANVLADSTGATGWDLVGLEFNGGGTFSLPTSNYRNGGIHHFRIHTILRS